MKAEVGVGLAVATAAAVTGWWIRKKKEGNQPTQWFEVGSVEELRLYPLKSGAALLCKEFDCTPTGPQTNDNRDRMLAIVKPDGTLVTGRDINKTVLITAELDNWTLKLTAEGVAPITANIEKVVNNQRQSLKIWQSSAVGVDCGDELAEWLSNFLQAEVRLLFYPNRDGKKLAKVYADLTFTQSLDGGLFSDATSFHLVNSKSVQELNTRLESPVNPRYFRPNIIISGDKLLPYEEDQWKWIKIGDTIFRVVAPCTRCLFTTVDPKTGERSEKYEPVKTLRSYRVIRDPKEKAIFGSSPVMGIYMGLRGGSGKLHIGDKISIGVA